MTNWMKSADGLLKKAGSVTRGFVKNLTTTDKKTLYGKRSSIKEGMNEFKKILAKK